MKQFSIKEYRTAGCPEVNDTIGYLLHRLCKGKICDTGCNRYDGGNCVAYKKLTTEVKLREDGTIETVRQEAKRRSVSIKQIRKERRDEAQ